MSFLPGMFPSGAMPQKALKTLSFVASTTSTGGTISTPAARQAGDLIVLRDQAYNSSIFTPTQVIPAGFTPATQISGAGGDGRIRSIVSYKIAIGNEGVLTGMSDVAQEKLLLIFRGNIPITSVIVGSPQSEITSGDPLQQVVGIAETPLVAIASYASSGGSVINPRSMTPTKDGEINISTNHYLAWKIFNSAPAEVIVDMDDENLNAVLQSCFFACS